MRHSAVLASRRATACGRARAVAFVALAALVAACGTSQRRPRGARIELTSPDGGRVDIAAPRGGLLVLVFWARSSPPSVPALEDVCRLSREADSGQARFVAVTPSAPDRLPLPVGDPGLVLNRYDADGTAGARFGVEALPTVLVLDSLLQPLVELVGSAGSDYDRLRAILGDRVREGAGQGTRLGG